MLTRLKADFLRARKDRKQVIIGLLSILISDAQMIGKNDGDRQVTDSEIIALVKKYIKNTEETLMHTDNVDVVLELAILEAYLPTQLTDDDIWNIVRNVSEEQNLNSPKQMGLIMKYFKENHDGEFDGASAARIAKEHLSQ